MHLRHASNAKCSGVQRAAPMRTLTLRSSYANYAVAAVSSGCLSIVPIASARFIQLDYGNNAWATGSSVSCSASLLVTHMYTPYNAKVFKNMFWNVAMCKNVSVSIRASRLHVFLGHIAVLPTQMRPTVTDGVIAWSVGLSVCRSVGLSRSWALQKRLNQSRCRLRCGRWLTLGTTY